MRTETALDPVILRVFHHYLYEYGRGVRGLFLMTMGAEEVRPVLVRLRREHVEHFVQQVSPAKVNLFFGRPAFVEVARCVVTKPLNVLTPEEDFMLGTMLGYDREQQCRRFLGKVAAREVPRAAAE